jgi:hypothetical protein
MWSNVDEKGFPEQSTIHMGDPLLTDTIKYGLNIWLCEK